MTNLNKKITRIFKMKNLFTKNYWAMKGFAMLVLVVMGGSVKGQTNPSAFALSGGNFTFTTQTATNTTYPTNMQGWNNGGIENLIGLSTAASTSDISMSASATASTIGLGNRGSNGFQFLTSGSAKTVGAIAIALNTTGRSNILVTWTAADQTNASGRQTNLTLQYRVGTSGNFTTVSGSTYTTNNGGVAGTQAASTFTNIALPSACDGQSVVQIRWLYYESASQSGSRDAITLDDITISSSSAVTPSIAISSAHPTAANITNGSYNNIIGGVKLDVTTADATLTGVSFTTAGNYLTSDIATNGLKFWLSNSANSIVGATQLGAAQAAAGNASTVSVSSLNNSIISGSTKYILLTADINNSATAGRTIKIGSTAFSNITFSSGNKTGTNPVPEGVSPTNDQTIIIAVPNIVVSSNHPIAGTINQSSTNQNIASLKFEVTTADATLNSITFTTSGTYQTSDLIASSFKLYYTTTNSFATTTQLGSAQSIIATGNTLTFSGLSQSITTGTSGYIWLTVDVAYNANTSRNISVTSTVLSNITFLSGTLSGTDPSNASNAQSFSELTPNVTISQVGPSIGNIANNTSNNILYQLSFATTDNATDINSITFNTAGTYVSADLSANSFKLWYNTSNNLTGAIQLGSSQSIVTSGNSITFSGLTQKINIGTCYLILTVDVAASTTPFNTINVTTTTFSNITLSAGNKLGTNPIIAGGVKTIIIDINNGDVLINQISPDYSGASNEYIEIVNKTGNNIDLSTLKISYQSSSGSNGSAGGILTGILAPYSFWLLSPDPTITVGQTVNLARDGSFTSGLSASNAQIAILRVSDNTIIDAIGYGTLTGGTFTENTTASNPPADGGLKRVIDGTDANFNNTDFTTVTNANIYLRNSNSRLGCTGSTIGSGNYTDFVVTGNTTLSGGVNISNMLSILGGTLTTGGNLTLKSTSTKTAYIPTISSGSISGNITVERYIPALRKFRFLAAPVVGATAAQWRDNGGTTPGIGTHITGNINGGINFDASTTNAASAFSYNESLAGSDVTVGSGATSDPGWTAFTDGNTQALTNGKGFRILVRGDRTISLTGGTATANPTTLSVTGTYPASSVIIATTKTNAFTNSGYNLVGNPYPATIDWNAVTKGANISATYTTYNPSSNSYVQWNGSTGDATRYIASGQAFFVQQTGATGGITIAEANKVTNAAGNFFRNKLSDHLKVSMTYDSANYDAAFIHFREDAQNDFDTYDGLKFQNAGVNIASVGTDGKRYNINSLSSLTKTTEMPLSVLGSVLTNFELKFEDVESFKNHELYLIDHYLNKMLLLSNGFTYPIALSSDSASVKDGRFKIVFVQKATGINLNEKNANAFILYPNPAANTIHLLLDAKNTYNENVSFEIFNQLGARLQQGNLDFTTAKDQAIAIDNLAQGSYFIKLQSNSNQQTIKFIK